MHSISSPGEPFSADALWWTTDEPRRACLPLAQSHRPKVDASAYRDERAAHV
jgi:hypothetical protein